MQVTATFERSQELVRFLNKLHGPDMQAAAARGLTEHAHEQRRLSAQVMASVTGLPKGRVDKPMSVTPAAPGPAMEARVVLRDRAIGLHEFGNPSWNADKRPRMTSAGPRGSRSSSAGAEATGWNRRKVYRGSFIGKGMVLIRKGGKLKMLSGPVLANELVDQKKSNSKSVERYMDQDLTNRVLRHLSIALGI